MGAISVEAFTSKENLIFVDFNIEFNALIFDITTLDLREAFVSGLDDKAGLSFLGDYAVDPDNVDFYVIHNALPLQGEEKVEVLDIVLPDWAWVIIFGGAISLAIIAMFGCVVGCNRWRESRILAQQYLSAKSLADFKSFQSLDVTEFEGNYSTAGEPLYKPKMKDNFWTTLQKESRSTKNATLDFRKEPKEDIYSKISLPRNYTNPNQKVVDWQEDSPHNWPKKPAHLRRPGSASSTDSDSGIANNRPRRWGSKQSKQSRGSKKSGAKAGAGLSSFRPGIPRVESVDVHVIGEEGAANRSRAQLLEDIGNQTDSDGSGHTSII